LIGFISQTPQELADNDFNLNIPRYVDTFEGEEEIDLKAVKKEITNLCSGPHFSYQDHIVEITEMVGNDSQIWL